MKLVSLESNEHFTRGKIYRVLGTSNYKDARSIFDDSGHIHFITLDYLFTNFSVLTFEEVR